MLSVPSFLSVSLRGTQVRTRWRGRNEHQKRSEGGGGGGGDERLKGKLSSEEEEETIL